MVSQSTSQVRIVVSLLTLSVPAILSVSQLARYSHAANETETAIVGDLAGAQTLGAGRFDPGVKMRGATECKNCHFHQLAGNAWGKSAHSASFMTRHKSNAAKKQIRALRDAKIAGVVRSMKTSERCIDCHYSGTRANNKFRAKEGVSCESCHGPADDWVTVHNDYGAGRTAGDEPNEHRRQRIAKSEAAGMIRSDAVYDFARNCLSCHIVDDEAVVNIGGHSSGSDEFELVAWSQGEVRHNFTRFNGPVKTAGNVNRVATQEKRRVMYVVGWAVDLSLSLEALAKAQKKNGKYATAMQDRVARALGKLQKVGGVAAQIGPLHAEISAINLGIAENAKLKNLAESAAAFARDFPTGHDRSKLAAVDAFLPAPESYRGTVYQP